MNICSWDETISLNDPLYQFIYASVNLLISLFVLLTLFVMGAVHRAENKSIALKKHMKAREMLSLHCDLLSQRRLEKHISHQGI